ncbi:MAG: polysaccharide deacetylase, partial [Clostridiales bacterium]|nr:polysaccharide deacetylase [Clostridiales bacterium]
AAKTIAAARSAVLRDEDAQNRIASALNRKKRYVYLTFDDGPSALTQQYLDILKAQDVRATFFLVGVNVAKYPRLTQAIYMDRHSIANHSYTHNYDKLYKSASALFSELERWDAQVSSALGFPYHTNVFRFPGGSTYKTAKQYRSQVTARGYVYYDWNCLNGDAQIRDKSADSLYDYMLATFKGQDEVIVLMHDTDTKQTTLDMLDRAIRFFKEQGYEFRTLGGAAK